MKNSHSSKLHLLENIITTENVHNKKYFFVSKSKIHHTLSPQKDITAIKPSQFRCLSLRPPYQKEHQTTHRTNYFFQQQILRIQLSNGVDIRPV